MAKKTEKLPKGWRWLKVDEVAEVGDLLCDTRVKKPIRIGTSFTVTDVTHPIRTKRKATYAAPADKFCPDMKGCRGAFDTRTGLCERHGGKEGAFGPRDYPANPVPDLIPIRAVDRNGVETPLPGADAVTFILGARFVTVKIGFGSTLHIDCADARPVTCAGNSRRLSVELYP
jgi:hypothetical protein